MDPLTEPHEPGGLGCLDRDLDIATYGSEHCYAHNVDEPSRPDDYRTCGECFHVFRTEQELIEAWLATVAPVIHDGRPTEPVAIPTGEQIYACPHCVHDF